MFVGTSQPLSVGLLCGCVGESVFRGGIVDEEAWEFDEQ